MSVRLLPKELQEKAINELNEVPSRTEEDIKQIQEWLEKVPHLNARKDDQWILNFLRGSKFSIQRAKERLDFYYTLRTLAPELLANRDPMLPEMQDILDKACVVPLSKTSEPGGPLVVIIQWRNVHPEKQSFVNLCKMLFMMVDILLLENDNFTVSGIIVLEDFGNFQYNYFLQMTPTISKQFMLILQSAFPIRIKGFYGFNVPSYMELIYNLFKPFMSEKLKSRVKFFAEKDFNDLLKCVPLSILPEEYGGEGGSMKEMTAEWRKKVESYRDWFLEDNKYCSDESKRPGKPKTSADVFGVEGSFRKLTVD